MKHLMMKMQLNHLGEATTKQG